MRTLEKKTCAHIVGQDASNWRTQSKMLKCSFITLTIAGIFTVAGVSKSIEYEYKKG